MHDVYHPLCVPDAEGAFQSQLFTLMEFPVLIFMALITFPERSKAIRFHCCVHSLFLDFNEWSTLTPENSFVFSPIPNPLPCNLCLVYYFFPFFLVTLNELSSSFSFNHKENGRGTKCFLGLPFCSIQSNILFTFPQRQSWLGFCKSPSSPTTILWLPFISFSGSSTPSTTQHSSRRFVKPFCTWVLLPLSFLHSL